MMHHKIHTLDLNFQGLPGTIAAYLIETSAGPVLIETGPGSTLATLQAQLGQHGYQPNDIRHIIVTHIHFDHAGAAGWWAQNGATLYVHHFGAQHLINPEKLLASATRIYGDRMGPLWGDILPAPADKVQLLADGDQVQVGDARFDIIETPGHARHHHVIRLGDVAFTGDVAGVRLLQSPLVSVPAPPPEFDLEAWRASLALLRQQRFTRIYPTHFGPIDDVDAHLDALEPLIEAAAAFVSQRLAAGMERDALLAEYVAWEQDRARKWGLSEEDIVRYEAANPLYMSVDGILRYWKKKSSA